MSAITFRCRVGVRVPCLPFLPNAGIFVLKGIPAVTAGKVSEAITALRAATYGTPNEKYVNLIVWEPLAEKQG